MYGLQQAVNIPSALLFPGVAAVGNLVFLVVLGAAARSAPWWHLRHNEDTHVLLATIVSLLLVWSMQAGVSPGLNLHFLGVTLATLMFGWQFAILAGSAVLLGVTLNADSGWQSIGWNGLLQVCLPVAVSWGVLQWGERRLPNNFFVYVFVAAFFGAALAILSVGVASTLFLWAIGAYPWDRLMDYYAIYYLLLVFPEGFLTGSLLTIFVVYRPAWVATFDDRRYLVTRSR